MVTIAICASPAEIERCFPVMAELRPHLSRDGFVARVNRQEAQGYQIAYLEEEGEIKSVAGFRIFEMLAFGKSLYVDDLVTRASDRSKGYGDKLFDWLVERARDERCDLFHLDSGTHRQDAHRFYLRKRMVITSFHFGLRLK
jgi:GNAT superfamily N-acetyltransferase